MTHITASNETPSEGSVCDDLDSEFPRGLHESDSVGLDVQGKSRVFDLDGRNRMNGMCPTKGRSRDLTEPDVSDFSSSIDEFAD